MCRLDYALLKSQGFIQNFEMGGGGGKSFGCPAVSGENRLCNTNSPSASVVIVIGNHLHMCAHAVFTSRSYYSRAVFIPFKSFGLCGYSFLFLYFIGNILSYIVK